MSSGPARIDRPGRYRPRVAGVTLELYDELLARQGGTCALCSNRPKHRRFSVDHDHKTGHIRGLLCHRCNRNLPTWVTAVWCDRAAEYLRRSSLEQALQADREREQSA